MIAVAPVDVGQSDTECYIVLRHPEHALGANLERLASSVDQRWDLQGFVLRDSNGPLLPLDHCCLFVGTVQQENQVRWADVLQVAVAEGAAGLVGFGSGLVLRFQAHCDGKLGSFADVQARSADSKNEKCARKAVSLE